MTDKLKNYLRDPLDIEWAKKSTPDDEVCIRCGKRALDTGWECTECGYDNYRIYGPPSKRSWQP